VELFTYSVDLTRVVFLVGAVLALLYKNKIGITPGGIIVPGILAVTLDISFIAFICTIILAVMCSYIYKLTVGSFALSARWAMLANVGISVIISLIAIALIKHTQLGNQELLLFSLIVPGLISQNSRKYGLSKVIYGTLLIAAATYSVGWMLALLLPHDWTTQLTAQLAAYKPLVLSHTYVVLTASLLMSILIYLKFKLRAGGYLTTPVLAIVAFSSLTQFWMLLAAIVISYLAVRLIQKYTLAIGLDRFIISLFCGYFTVTTIDHIAVTANIAHYRPSPLVLIVAVAVLTNDLCLQSVRDSVTKGIVPSVAVSLLVRAVL
jgi:hypothetical protein